jgi:hypothetical protein
MLVATQQPSMHIVPFITPTVFYTNQNMRAGRNQFSQYLTYNPDLRERAIVDRIYHSFKNTPYANRRLIVQAQFSFPR